jgi:hypothetical protein
MKDSKYLAAAADAETRQAITLGKGWPSSLKVKVGDVEKELPVTYLDKDVIETGDYIHPQTGQKFSVSGDRLDRWVKTFDAMRSAGIEIPAPTDHSSHARDNLGFIVAAKRVGNRLRLTHQVIGEDAVAVAMRNRASIRLEPDYVDEKGKRWGEAIVHSAFTPVPVVSGMGSFQPFAASRDPEAAPVYQLARELGDQVMLTEEHKSKIRALAVKAGKTQDQANALTDEQSIAFLLESAGTAETKVTEASTALSRVELERDELKRNLEAKTIELSRSTPRQIDTDVLRDRADTFSDKIDLLAERGKITPAQQTKAKGLLKDAAGAPSALMLSRNGDDAYPIQKVLDVLVEGNPAPATGTKTGIQLSREVPGDVKKDASYEEGLKQSKEWADQRVKELDAAKA